jgi:hypothetical protein
MSYGSGYNQDSNQLTPASYRVTLTMSNATYYPTAIANTSSGAVNPYDWDNQAYTNYTALNAAQALVLAQGNVRWATIIQQLSNIADCRIENVNITATNQVASTNATPSTATGAFTLGTLDATQQPSALSFTVVFDRDEFILGEWNLYLKSIGQSTNGTYVNEVDAGITPTAYTGIGGSAISNTALALQDIITNALWLGGATSYSRNYRVYNPAQIGDSQVKVTIGQPVATAAQVFGTVAVTQISGTTLIGNPL